MKDWKWGLLSMLLMMAPVSAEPWQAQIASRTEAHASEVVALRHWFHANPELGNREFNTAARIASELRALGFDEVREGVAHTGVIGILRGGQPGPVVALRADMDALPVKEKTGVPFASTVTTLWGGIETGVMHACGHDAHMAILLGVARVLSDLRAEMPGAVMFIFQPAEEGPPGDEEGGAQLMLKEGIFTGADRPGAVFGLHVFPGPTGSIMYRPNGFMAASDYLEIEVEGVQTHGSMPWGGVDPIVSSALVINSLQTVVSRQMDISKAPAVVTIGTIAGGNRGNIISERVLMTGTIRTLDPEMQTEIHERVRRTAIAAAAAMGATAKVTIDVGYPVTVNDPKLTQEMTGVLDWAANGAAAIAPPVMGAEDFSYLAMAVPGLFFALGVLPEVGDDRVVGVNHSPYFYVNDRALPVGIRALSGLALTWLSARAPQ
jgi:amidohydrolase|tara:strand:- start:6141 stop:7445 length:1305 start_codon:yes stop_codon:yes gene_type:complete